MLGIGRRHHHVSNLRKLSTTLPISYDKITISLEDTFTGISKSELSICATSCPMYKKKRCDATGKMAPIGKGCEAQLISRRER